MFAAYDKQTHHLELIFTKARVALLKSRNLPTLDLMAVYLEQLQGVSAS